MVFFYLITVRDHDIGMRRWLRGSVWYDQGSLKGGLPRLVKLSGKRF